MIFLKRKAKKNIIRSMKSINEATAALQTAEEDNIKIQQTLEHSKELSKVSKYYRERNHLAEGIRALYELERGVQ